MPFRRASDRPAQRHFRFVERARRRERQFKRFFLGITLLLVAAPFLLLPTGRTALARLGSQVGRLTARLRGREAIEAETRKRRLIDADEARSTYASQFAGYRPGMQAMLRAAKLDPDQALLRWGNYDRTLMLSSDVYEADDQGRSYRLIPRVRSVWVRNPMAREGVLTQFLVPENAATRDAVKAAAGSVVEGSEQAANSWGLRGPEPDPTAPLRGLVLGDSFMQGMFLGESDTPPERLRRRLETDLSTRASVVNTGLIGYSPEQYYAALVAFADRIKPHFVLVGVYANDFGAVEDVLEGRGDWDEARLWLGRIREFCKSRRIPWLVVAAPVVRHVTGERDTSAYPGKVPELAGALGSEFLDPTDAFASAHLEAMIRLRKPGQPEPPSPLFNIALADHHFSAEGSELWARVVAERLRLLLEASGFEAGRP